MFLSLSMQVCIRFTDEVNEFFDMNLYTKLQPHGLEVYYNEQPVKQTRIKTNFVFAFSNMIYSTCHSPECSFGNVRKSKEKYPKTFKRSAFRLELEKISD